MSLCVTVGDALDAKLVRTKGLMGLDAVLMLRRNLSFVPQRLLFLLE